jgi:hypothetical protein
MTTWNHNGLVEWQEGNTAYLSVVFSWNKPEAYQRAMWQKAMGKTVKVGGPAVRIDPDYFGPLADLGDYPDAVALHNPDATFTSRGCPRQCPFCAVPKTEGSLIELDDWPVRPIICDNNLLACSKVHFDRVIDCLKPLKGVDFNQGLDARFLTAHHANRLTELDLRFVRLAWDNVGMERQFRDAWRQLTRAGIPARKVRVYVLIGYNDTPEDALYRLESVRALGTRPNPMRYHPLDAIQRNSYVGPNWTDAELKRYMRYWSRLAWLEHIPFSEYRHYKGLPA